MVIPRHTATRTVVRCAVVALAASLSGLGVAAHQQPSDSTALQITQEGDAYLLTVPVSRLLMKLPKDRWVYRKGGPDGSNANPRYFYFDEQSKEKLVVVSGWFEPDTAFKGLEAFWADESAKMTSRGLPPEKVTFEDVGSWKTVLYGQVLEQINSAHMRANLVQGGTWVDLHLSLTSFRPLTESWNSLRSVLKGIMITEKAKAP
jgi:hypothetical protein